MLLTKYPFGMLLFTLKTKESYEGRERWQRIFAECMFAKCKMYVHAPKTFGMLTRRQKPAASEDGWQGTANHQVIRGCSMKRTA